MEGPLYRATARRLEFFNWYRMLVRYTAILALRSLKRILLTNKVRSERAFFPIGQRDETEGREKARILAALVFKQKEQTLCDIRACVFSRSNFYFVLELPHPVLVEGLVESTS